MSIPDGIEILLMAASDPRHTPPSGSSQEARRSQFQSPQESRPLPSGAGPFVFNSLPTGPPQFGFTQAPRKSEEQPQETESDNEEETPERKKRHNAVERRRRNVINDNIAELRRVVPEDTRFMGDRSKMSKASVLREAIRYINNVNDEIRARDDAMRRLYLENESLRAHFMQMQLQGDGHKANLPRTPSVQSELDMVTESTHSSRFATPEDESSHRHDDDPMTDEAHEPPRKRKRSNSVVHLPDAEMKEMTPVPRARPHTQF